MDMNQLIDQAIQDNLPEFIALRHKLHQCPELRYEEIMTSNLVAENLIASGYTPKINLAKTGITALLDTGKAGKTVALRADMDALPIQEATNLSYSSKNAGFMHACGHDGHTATLLLVAKVLQQIKSEFSGKIKLIFQPAEEGGHGAKSMIDAGALEDPSVEAIFGYHNLPTFPENKILLKSGCILAGTSLFEMIIKGVGGHSSAPEKTIDPIYIGSTIVQNIQSIISRNISPFESVVISITQFHAGTADNVIPETAVLRGTIRFIDNETITSIKEKLHQVVSHTAQALGAEATLNFLQDTPATINTTTETQLVRKTAITLFGEHQIEDLTHNIMATEDFSFYLQKIPGCYFMIGTGENKTYLHHPLYEFNDQIIPVAAKLLLNTALNFLKHQTNF